MGACLVIFYTRSETYRRGRKACVSDTENKLRNESRRRAATLQSDTTRMFSNSMTAPSTSDRPTCHRRSGSGDIGVAGSAALGWCDDARCA